MNKGSIPFLLISFLFLTTTSLVAQEEDEACLPPSKKVEKTIHLAVKTEDSKAAVTLFLKAIEAAPDNAMVYYEYAMYAYEKGVYYYQQQPNPAMGDRSFEKAREMFQQALTNCSDYHANCSYYLGVIAYSKKEYETATKWFKQFLAYKHTDNSRYPEDYDTKVTDVKTVLAEFEQEQQMQKEQVPFNPKLVENVSSTSDEYFPMISPDNELMFFTRKLDRAALGDLRSNVVEEFTFSQRASMEDKFDIGKPLRPPFNDGTFSNYGSATLSVDNKEMIICACKKEQVYTQEYLNCDLYSTIYERSGKGGNDFTWSPLKNLGEAINTKDGWEAQPSLSADGNTLYYAVARPTSRDNDIYVSQRRADGTWEPAKPFNEVNTDGKDKSPFLHQDSETFYFVSSSTDSRKGIGGLDIFYTRRENGKWTTPKNIGYPINSKQDEIGLFVSTDGKLAYYSSQEKGGNWNIYAFDLYEVARPKKVAILKGELKDQHGEPVKDATIEIAYANSNQVTKVKVNGDDGKYSAVVSTEEQQDIMVTVNKDGFAFDSKVVDKKELGKNTTVLRDNDLKVKKLKVGEAYTINDILYATNSTVLSERAKFILKGFARFLNEHPTMSIAIQGHTDDVGDDAQNLLLSENRAKGVKEYLATLGIDEKRLSAKGYGETHPNVANDSEENRAKNRRTDFVIEKL